MSRAGELADGPEIAAQRSDLLRIALVQQPPPAANEATGLALAHLDAAAAADAELMVLPELWSTGYSMPDPATARSASLREKLTTDRRRYVSRIAAGARGCGVAVVAPYLGPGGPGELPRNCAAFIDGRGRVLLEYAKVHVARFAGEAGTTGGTRIRTARWRRLNGRDLEVGILICYDRVFPEAARELALRGAELVLIPNAGLICDNRLAQVGTRAFENQYATALANYTGGGADGRSVVFDGVAFTPAGEPRDHTVFLAGREPGVFVAELSVTSLQNYRAAQPWGLADRVPAAYELIARQQPGDPSVHDRPAH